MQIAWKATTEERYFEMLGMLPPEFMAGNGFLVGEPYSHRTCRISGRVEPTFTAFICDDEDYFEAETPLTIAEFRASALVRC